MAGHLFSLPQQVPLDAGAVSPGAKLYFYQTGTSTPQDTYQDLALLTAHANPVVADANGAFAPIYLDPTSSDYRVTLRDSDDNLIYTEDDIPAGVASRTIILTDANPFVDLIESDASANNGVWRIGVNSEQLSIQVGNDAKDTFANAISIDRTANTIDSIKLNSVEALATTGDNSSMSYNGFSAAPSFAAIWRKIGEVVYLYLGHGTGTSNATTFGISLLDGDLAVSSAQGGPILLVDNGVEVLGTWKIAAGGPVTITFSVSAATFGAGGGFTASGNKGIAGSNVYQLITFSTASLT